MRFTKQQHNLKTKEMFKLFKVKSESRSIMSDSLRPHSLYSPWTSPGQNTVLGRLSLLQGIFPTQGSNPGLPYSHSQDFTLIIYIHATSKCYSFSFKIYPEYYHFSPYLLLPPQSEPPLSPSKLLQMSSNWSPCFNLVLPLFALSQSDALEIYIKKVRS